MRENRCSHFIQGHYVLRKKWTEDTEHSEAISRLPHPSLHFLENMSTKACPGRILNVLMQKKGDLPVSQTSFEQYRRAVGTHGSF